MVQGETLTLEHLTSCTFNIAFIICRSALLQHDTALPEHNSQARWRMACSIHEQSSLWAMSEAVLWGNGLWYCSGGICISMHMHPQTAALTRGVELHWFPCCSSLQLNSVELSRTAYGDYGYLWWFLMFFRDQSLEDNEGFILPLRFTATGGH